MRPVIVLDYDGVLLDSLCEKFVIGFNSYLHVVGQTSLMRGIPLTLDDFAGRIAAEAETFDRFRQLVPLIGEKGENAAAFRLIEAGTTPADRPQFMTALKAFDAGFLSNCSRTVAAMRAAMHEADRQHVLCPFFDCIVDDVRRLADSVDFVVCSNKPLDDIRRYNRDEGLDDILGTVLTCSADDSKASVLLDHAGQHGLRLDGLAFVDDFLRHLVPASAAGIPCFHATWGYDREPPDAIDSGSAISRLDMPDFGATMRRFAHGAALQGRRACTTI
jgi:phosphoglycolate phosphatase-like HAD superfamily hydrolase